MIRRYIISLRGGGGDDYRTYRICRKLAIGLCPHWLAMMITAWVASFMASLLWCYGVSQNPIIIYLSMQHLGFSMRHNRGVENEEGDTNFEVSVCTMCQIVNYNHLHSSIWTYLICSVFVNRGRNHSQNGRCYVSTSCSPRCIHCIFLEIEIYSRIC
jgi:hypothetical protein